MKKPYLFRYGDPEAFRLIPQKGLTVCLPQGYTGYNCCWDATLSPDGIFYLSLGSEGGEGNYAYLNRYNEAENRIESCFYTRDYINPPEIALPGSKLHSCISFLPDGRIICNNHTTDKAPQHPEWLPYSYAGHVWEGFPGSTIFIYDPKTGKVESHGIPVPQETIYGGVYCEKNNAYYMIGFMHGHLYKFDLNTYRTTDLGKAIEYCSHRLHVGPDGNVYASSPTGFLMRVNTDTDVIEWTGIRFPHHNFDIKQRVSSRYASTYMNLDDHRMLIIGAYNNLMYVYDIQANELTHYGQMQGADEIYQGYGNWFYGFNGDLDADGVLWYSMTVRMVEVPEGEQGHTNPAPAYLYRWDWQNPDAAPENLGVIGQPGLTVGLISELRIDTKRNILFCSAAADKQYGPPVIRLDLNAFKAALDAGEKGPLQSDPRYEIKPVDPPKPGEKKGQAYEGGSFFNNHQAFQPGDVTFVRLWTEARGDEKNTAVRGLYWEDARTVRGVCGAEAPKYAFSIRDAKLESFVLLDTLPEAEREALIAKACPQPEAVPEGVQLPYVAGRQYLAVPACDAAWSGGRRLIGTKDGKLALRDGEDVCCYGLMSAAGPVRALCANAAGTKAFGAAGHDKDLSRLFKFDEKHGVQELGLMLMHTKMLDHIIAPERISAMALNPGEDQLAIGTEDWIAAVYFAKV